MPQLGYDPTMSLLSRNPINELDAQWYVEAPDGQRFRIFEPIILNRAKVLVGRATRAWKAWREKDESIEDEEKREVRLCFAMSSTK